MGRTNSKKISPVVNNETGLRLAPARDKKVNSSPSKETVGREYHLQETNSTIDSTKAIIGTTLYDLEGQAEV